MRAGKIFINDLRELGLLERVQTIKVALYALHDWFDIMTLIDLRRLATVRWQQQVQTIVNICYSCLLTVFYRERVRTLWIPLGLCSSSRSSHNSHHTPQAILLGLEGCDPETVETDSIQPRYDSIVNDKTLLLGGSTRIQFDMDRDMVWRWDQVLKTHSNGMRFSCFDAAGDLLATNEYFRSEIFFTVSVVTA